MCSSSSGAEADSFLCRNAANLSYCETLKDQSGTQVARDLKSSSEALSDSGSADGVNSEKQQENTGAVIPERNWIRPDLPSKCTWRVGAPLSESPHSHPPR